MKCSIFIKSWKQDLSWLAYALRFIECNWREPDTEVVVVLDQDCQGALELDGLAVQIYYETPWPDGYSHAMYVKTLADTYCDGDLIVLADSDTVLLEPASLADFQSSGKLVIPYLSYAEHLEQHPNSPWQKITEALTRRPANLHYMGRNPICYERSTFAGLRETLSQLHRILYRDLVYSVVPFDYLRFSRHPITLMDYDLLGWYAHEYQKKRYDFQHLSVVAPNKWRQFHSWTERPEDQNLHRRLRLAFNERANVAGQLPSNAASGAISGQ